MAAIQTVGRIIRLLARLDMTLGVAMALTLLAWLTLH
jgi:hypothetical protein